MVFSEPVFLFVFLPVALIILSLALFAFPKSMDQRSRPGFHCAAILGLSLAFYYWSSGAFVLLLISCGLLNWAIGLKIVRVHQTSAASKSARLWLGLGLVLNLAPLAYFKYAHFLSENLDAVTGSRFAPTFADLVLPVGISFFSFQGLSYLIDLHRGDADPEPNPLVFGAYLTFFPQLIAGPIVRYRDVIEDYRKPNPSLSSAAYGVRRFSHGLMKKVLIADSVAPIADTCFAMSPDEMSQAAAWIGALAYAVQIYFDFSGYSDMAIGLAALLGISLEENFDRPYASRSITEFWRRWHISLSSWFRDYLYIPLGGNRVGTLTVYRNLLIVFVATGLWHGAAWNFLAWGLYHGSFLVLERGFLGRDRLAAPPSWLRWLYVAPVTIFGWVLFRAESLSSAFIYWRLLLTPEAITSLPPALIQVLTPATLAMLSIGTLAFSLPRKPSARDTLRPDCAAPLEAARIVYVAVGLALCGLMTLTRDFSPFLYFRF